MTGRQGHLEMIYFSQPDCGVCHSLKEKVEKLVREQFNEISFKEINIALEPEQGARYMIFSSPVIVVLYDGKEVYRKAGNFALHQFQQEIERLLNLMV